MKSDKRLQRNIEAAFGSDPQIALFPVSVAVHDGIVTLTGRVRTLEQKRHLLASVQRVGGFKGLIVDLEFEPLMLDEDSNVHSRHELRNAPL